MPNWLPAALPARSDKRGWRDAVAIWLLCEIIGAHRIARGQTVFFRGPLYQVERVELARDFGTDVDEISEALNWLRQIGVLEVIHRTRIDCRGQPTGMRVFAYPIMSRLDELRQQFQATGKTPAPVKYEPRRAKRTDPHQGSQTSSSAVHVVEGSTAPTSGFDLPDDGACVLTAPQERQKLDADASGGEVSTQWHDDRRDDRRSLDGGGGGGDAAADQNEQTPANSFPTRSGHEPPAASSTWHRQVAPGQPAAAAPPPWRPARPPSDLIIETPDQQRAWKLGCRLCVLYAEVFMRSGHARTCKLNHNDSVRAFNYFNRYPQCGAFYVTSVFILALMLVTDNESGNGYDKLWHSRWAVDFRRFLAYLESGRIESEIGRAGTKINTWRALRLYFTQSELIHFGWDPNNIPAVRIDPDDIWEADPDAADYYQTQQLPLPVEVQVVLDNRNKHDKPRT
jgi:hypothetical protein